MTYLQEAEVEGTEMFCKKYGLKFRMERYDLSYKIFDAVQTTGVSKISQTVHGTKYEVPMLIDGRKGRSLLLKTVWQVDKGSNIPRLITITFNKKNAR